MKKFSALGLTLIGILLGLLLGLQVSAFAEKETKIKLPIEDLRIFAEVFGAIKQGYVEPIEDKKLITNAISGMLSNLDPHSAYLDGEAFRELQDGTQGEFGGLGLEVGMEDGLVKVVSPIEDTPADRADIQSGDLVFKLDDTPVKGLTLTDAVKKMRGKPGTKIRLSIIRKGANKPIELTLTREVIKIQSVKSKVLEDAYAYVRITSFQENTGQDVVKHLSAMIKTAPLKGLILDLRNDPGGLLNAAVGVAGVFLPPQTLVTSTDGRLPDSKHQLFVNPSDYLRGTRAADYLKELPEASRKLPMVVLINGGSASASEIVAGALQDHKRATIMGTTSFGKGSVQTILPLPGNAAIKLTTARYFTPSGRSIQAKGIEPDVLVEDKNTPFASLQVREADLEHHLTNPNDKNKPEEKTPPKPVLRSSDPRKVGNEPEEEDVPKKRELASKDDFQLTQALNQLKGLPVLSAPLKKEGLVKQETIQEATPKERTNSN